MGDIVKIGVKTALIAVITAGVIALFATIQIPSVNFNILTQGLSTGLAVIYHYAPITTVLYPIVLTLLAFDVGFRTFQLAMIAVKWVMKVNE